MESVESPAESTTHGESLLPYITERIGAVDPGYADKVRAYLDREDTLFHERAEAFLRRYCRFIANKGKSLDFGIDCFLKLRTSMAEERLYFIHRGEYSSKSFEEVNRRVYGNPETMEYHMHGLVFAQFLWPDQYRRFSFFSGNLPMYRQFVRRYLEVGGGHGLYLTEAVRVFDSQTEFDLVDISPSSIELARGIAQEPRIRHHLMDILDFPASAKYDFITMGEVLEHVERPRDLLGKVRDLLSAGGSAYITTPANAPTLDHIYLFNNAQEIRDLLERCGFVIEREVTQYASDMPPKQAERLKIPLMFAAFVKCV